MVMKLGNNNLYLKGSTVPGNKEAIKEAILDTFNACIGEGAEDLKFPTQPLTYTSLISILKEKGLVQGPTPPPASTPAQSPEVIERLNEHREEVSEMPHKT